MGTRVRLSSVLTVALIALIGTPGLLAAQDQDQEQDVGEAIGREPGVFFREEGDQVGRSGEALRSGILTFNHGAYLIERDFPEAVVAKVLKGDFALRVQDDVVVDPQDNAIAILEADPAIGVATPTPNTHDFTQIGSIPNEACAGLRAAAPTAVLCLINPRVIADQLGVDESLARTYFVALHAGDTVYVPAGSECFFCNITGPRDADPSDANTRDRAQLLVWTSRSFRWEEMAAAPPSTAIRGWMRNPGSPCH